MSYERFIVFLCAAVMLLIFIPSTGSSQDGCDEAARSYMEFPASSMFIGADGVETSLGFGDNLGDAVACGDINGDGLEDLIISAPWGDGPGNARNDSGEIYVFLGNASRNYGAQILLPDMVDIIIYGADPGDGAGMALAAGDIDNDGFDDLVIGSPNSDGIGNAVSNAGEVAIIYGGNDTYLQSVYDLNTTTFDAHPNATIHGNDVNFRFGFEILLADLDNDMFDDVFVTEQWGIGETGVVNNAGRVYIAYGSPARWNSNSLASDTVMPNQVYGNNADDHFGWKMDSGDLDDDNKEDIVIAAELGDGTLQQQKFSSGEVYVIFGGGPRITGAGNDIIDNLDTVIYGADAGDESGRSVAVGDLDDDGKDDIIIGAVGGSGELNDRDHAGEISIIWGTNQGLWTTQINLSQKGTKIFGALEGDWFGFEVMSDDLNNDGYDDMAVYSREADGLYDDTLDTGSVTVIYGHGMMKGMADACILDSNDMITIMGTQEEELFGFSLESFDINNDGKQDLIAGSKWYNHDTPGLMTHCGAVHAYPSLAPSPTRNEAVQFQGLVDLGGNKTAPAGHPVKLVVNVTDDSGAASISEVAVFINRGAEGVRVDWAKAAGFTTGVVTNSSIEVLASSQTVDAGNTKTLEFDITFGWEEMTVGSVEVLSVGTGSDLDRYGFNIAVMLDLELKGGLVVEHNGSAVESGTWRAAGDALAYTNTTLVYKGTNIGPLETDFIPVVVTADGNWTDATYSPGSVLSIDVVLGQNETTDYSTTLTVKPQKAALMSITVPSKDFVLKVDNGTPEMNSGITCRPDNDTESYIDNDEELFLSWSEASDSGAGVSHYVVGVNGVVSATNKTWTRVSGVAEGNVNLSVSAVDMLGHISPAEYETVSVDLTPVSITISSPANSTEFNTTGVDVNVTITDLLTGVDGASIQYRVSSNGTENYADWVDYPEVDDNLTLECGIGLSFPEGSGNYVQWRASDLAGNAMESQNLNVIVSLPVVNDPPSAVMTEPKDGSELETGLVTFDAGGSSDPDGDDITFTWLLDGIEVGTGEVFEYNFTAAGNYTVTLIVEDSFGNSARTNATLSIVEPQGPVPDDDVIDDNDDDPGIHPLFIAIPIIILVLVVILVVVIVLVMMKKSRAKREAELEKALAEDRGVWEEEKRQEEIARADPNAFVAAYEREKDSEYVPPGAGGEDQVEQDPELLSQEPRESLPPGPELVDANVPVDGEGIGEVPTQDQMRADPAGSPDVPSEEYGTAPEETVVAPEDAAVGTPEDAVVAPEDTVVAPEDAGLAGMTDPGATPGAPVERPGAEPVEEPQAKGPELTEVEPSE